jgi:hypothetical protein
VCTGCGIIGADARPNWREKPGRNNGANENGGSVLGAQAARRCGAWLHPDVSAAKARHLGAGFQGEVRKRHLSMPPLKRALRTPAGPIIRQLMAEAETTFRPVRIRRIVRSAIRALTYVNLIV